ncbi:MAG: 50S ribosomal protein L35 [Deltaproteobacteria bacterium]|nr:50S ribosomal protein L35 [Deltaproteobacteria bacterium]
MKNKLKSKRGVKKRFKVTAKGKVKYTKAFRRHILTKKTTKSKRQMRKNSYLSAADAKAIKGMLLY